MKVKQAMVLFVMMTALFASGCGGGGSSGQSQADEPVVMTAAKLLIEHNATDEDTGFQGFADGDPWNSLAIGHPGFDQIVTVLPEGNLIDFGLTEFFFETSEPPNADVPISEVLARLAQGEYAFTGDMVSAQTSSLSADFSHNIPAGPVLLAPNDGATGLDPAAVVVSWEPVSKTIDGDEIDIIGYQVIVEEDAGLQFPQGFAKPQFSIYLPASVTSISVPGGFLRDNACYKYEVFAIEVSGNQTFHSAAFETGTGCVAQEPEEEETPKMKAAKLLIEHNATDEDTGFQGFADGDPWNELVISGPGGELVLTVLAKGGFFDFGLTELFFETSEPPNATVPIDEVLARLPAGNYTFTGEMVGGGPCVMTAEFTHKIPAGPVLVTPADGATHVDPGHVVVSWETVSEDINGLDINIVGYQVIVESTADPQYPQGFAKPVFSIYLPASATSVPVPAEFMKTGANYSYEVLAIEESGNQTLSSAKFSTR